MPNKFKNNDSFHKGMVESCLEDILNGIGFDRESLAIQLRQATPAGFPDSVTGSRAGEWELVYLSFYNGISKGSADVMQSITMREYGTSELNPSLLHTNLRDATSNLSEPYKKIVELGRKFYNKLFDESVNPELFQALTLEALDYIGAHYYPKEELSQFGYYVEGKFLLESKHIFQLSFILSLK